MEHEIALNIRVHPNIKYMIIKCYQEDISEAPKYTSYYIYTPIILTNRIELNTNSIT